MTFEKLGLHPLLLKALSALDYAAPTPIQRQAIPILLQGHDLLATAQTGTGKTASFALPIIQQLAKTTTSGQAHKRRPKRFRALVLTPTRELALQVQRNFEQYSQYLEIKTSAIVGGVDYDPQKNALIDGLDILIATPGRLLDLAQQRALHFDELQTLVIDEADRMLDMGFIDEINKILEKLPEQRQSCLFSATLSKGVRLLAKTTIQNPKEITIAPSQQNAPAISQWVIATDKHNKSALLSQLIHEQNWQQALIFIRTQHGAAKLASQLQKRGISADTLHGGRSQGSRNQVLADFKNGKIPFLIATGVAARGIDIQHLERVVNYDLPDDADEYIHRIGRTGRAGNNGEAVSLVSKDDFKRLCAIERRQEKIIERRIIEGFSVAKDLPPSNLNFVIKSQRS